MPDVELQMGVGNRYGEWRSIYVSILVYPSLSCHLAGTLEGLSVHALCHIHMYM